MPLATLVSPQEVSPDTPSGSSLLYAPSRTTQEPRLTDVIRILQGLFPLLPELFCLLQTSAEESSPRVTPSIDNKHTIYKREYSVDPNDEWTAEQIHQYRLRSPSPVPSLQWPEPYPEIEREEREIVEPRVEERKGSRRRHHPYSQDERYIHREFAPCYQPGAIHLHNSALRPREKLRPNKRYQK